MKLLWNLPAINVIMQIGYKADIKWDIGADEGR